jgi:hypothetical protein
VLVRTKYPKGDLLALPILNGVQFWPIAGKALLGQFFRRALEIARMMPEEAIVWGADTLALAELLKPLTAGVQDRVGLRVALMDSGQILAAFAETQIQWLKAGRFKRFMATYAVLDFRGNRKPYMQPVYEATVAAGVTV